MRFYVAVVLVLCGTLMAIAPIASDFIQNQQIAELVSHGAEWTYVRPPLKDDFCVASWIMGGAMIGLGIIRGWQPAGGKSVDSAIVS
jgi:hypothetical protein